MRIAANISLCHRPHRTLWSAPKPPQPEDAPPHPDRLCGSVLPTVVVVSVVMLTALLGLLMLWEQETMLSARSRRLRQARADAESAYAIYRLHPDDSALTAAEGYLLDDSLPRSRVFVRAEPWGLYETVQVRTADSVLHLCRLFGAEPVLSHTFFYTDNRSALTIAGQTLLHGTLRLPQNGLIYGRVGSDFYRGPEIPQTVILRSERSLPQPVTEAAHRVDSLLAAAQGPPEGILPDSLCVSFLRDSAAIFRVGDAEIGGCTLRGRIVLLGGELRIDSTCRLDHALVVARKITVGSGIRGAAQFFASDTLIVEPRAVLAYPSGIYAGIYAQIGDRSEVNGYAIVRDTIVRKKVSANYRQSRTARLRGLVWVDGTAQVQGIVSGRAVLRRAVYFSPQGYYRDMLYDFTLLENPVTAQPLWLTPMRRKEAVCVD